MAGSVLHGTYTLVEPLGRGGMGVVWRARHTRLPRPVAIKILHETAYHSQEVLQRFRREAEITSQLGHPNIVQVFDFNVLEDGRAYLVMEMLEGQSLRDRLDEGPLAPDQAAAIVRQVGSALSRVHREGIVHRDLKPENIFLCATEDGSVLAKVLDFGISKVHGSMTVVTQDTELLGTPRYMSPEQARGENTALDASTDQFALAAIAYEMFTGKPAFDANSVPAVLYKVSSEDPTPIQSMTTSVSRRVGHAIHRALAKKKAERFPSMSQFLAAFEEPTEKIPSRSAPQRRGGRPWAVGAAVAALTMLGVAMLALRTEPVNVEALEEPLPLPAAVEAVSASDGRMSASDAFSPTEGEEDPSLAQAETATDSRVRAASDARDDDAAHQVQARPRPKSPEASTRPRRSPRPAPSARNQPRLPGQDKQQVDRAQRAVEAGRYRRALMVGRRGLRDGVGPEIYVWMTAAYCGLKDLAGARAMYRSVPRGLRGQASEACAKLGLSLD
ncbi:MAG: serine/threonine-protein kinase [Myxococcota bacterium]